MDKLRLESDVQTWKKIRNVLFFQVSFLQKQKILDYFKVMKP